MAYADSQGDSASIYQQTENDIEKHGLTVGRRTKISALKARTSRYCIYITTLLIMTCLVLLPFSSLPTPHIVFTPKEAAAATSKERAACHLPRPIKDLASSKHAGSPSDDDPPPSPTWSVSSFTDITCRFNRVSQASGIYTSNCNKFPADATNVVWDANSPSNYTVNFYPTAECADSDATSFIANIGVCGTLPQAPLYYKAHVC